MLIFEELARNVRPNYGVPFLYRDLEKDGKRG
jgi:hypothetical protein